MKIIHVVNPVKVNPKSDLYDAQPITFESMHRSKKFLECRGIADEVTLAAACYPEDESIVPDYFDEKFILKNSVLDFGDFDIPKKLPLVSEIIQKANSSGSYDFLIYTNVDIALQPFFYEFVFEQLNSGIDGLVINRRTIPKYPGDIKKINSMYAEIGETHKGYDCFIMKCENIHLMEWGNVCIGANWVGRMLLTNTTGFSENFQILKNSHLTFHLGNDKDWTGEKFKDYEIYNTREAFSAMKSLKKKEGYNSNEIISDFIDKLRRKAKKLDDDLSIIEGS